MTLVEGTYKSTITFKNHELWNAARSAESILENRNSHVQVVYCDISAAT